MKNINQRTAFYVVAVFSLFAVIFIGEVYFTFLNKKTDQVPVKKPACPPYHIDTLYNYIEGKEPRGYDKDAMRIELDDLIRDNGCLINQETVVFVWWSPLGNNSEIKL